MAEVAIPTQGRVFNGRLFFAHQVVNEQARLLADVGAEIGLNELQGTFRSHLLIEPQCTGHDARLGGRQSAYFEHGPKVGAVSAAYVLVCQRVAQRLKFRNGVGVGL